MLPETLLLLFSAASLASSAPAAPLPIVDRQYEFAKAVLRAPETPPESRRAAIDSVLTLNAVEAADLIAPLLNDSSPKVRKGAAERLADLGDERGLREQMRCLRGEIPCEMRYDAARLLGNQRWRAAAPLIATDVEQSFARGLRDGRWNGTAEDRAIIRYGAIALARIDPERHKELIFRVAEADATYIVLEALSYINDPRTKKLLWAVYDARLPLEHCPLSRRQVEALLGLSRVGDAAAIDRLKNALLGRDPALNDRAKLTQMGCESGASFLSELRPRDAANFADTVFQLAAAEPETEVTFVAWESLGVMRPSGFGERVLKLALSKRPHWKTVSCDMLNKVVIAIQPELNERFWDGFDVQSKPEMLAEKRLVEKRVSYFMFTGTGNWTGD